MNIYLQDIEQPMVLVKAKTGVTYTHQCGGFNCDQMTMEGFLAPVSMRPGTLQLMGQRCDRLTKAIDCKDPARIVHEVKSLDFLVFMGDEPQDVLLDTTKAEEIIEAWVPVTVTVAGMAAYLIWENSD